MSENIFANEWLECLRAHYMHVIRTDDRVTLPSLTVVMQQAGFSESDLAELRVRATMHIDDVGADFVPDLDVLETQSVQVQGVEMETLATAADESSPQVTEEAFVPDASELPDDTLIDESSLDEEEAESEAVIESVIEELPEDDPDAPQQLSLF